MPDAASERTLGSCETSDFLAEEFHQLGLGVRPPVGEAPLEMVPDALVGIEVRRIRRKRNEVKALGPLEKLPNWFPTVDVPIVEKDEDVSANLAEKMPEEVSSLPALDVVFVEVAVKCATKSPRTYGDSRNRRDPIMPLAESETGCLADWAPRLPDGRNQEETGFVDEDDVGAQPCGVFFTRGQTSFFQSSTSSSFRSRARGSGF